MAVDIVEGLCSLAWFTGAAQGLALGLVLGHFVRSSDSIRASEERRELARTRGGR